MAFKMRGWSPFKQEVKGREGSVYVGPNPTIHDKEGNVVTNPNYVEGDEYKMSDRPFFEGQGESTHLIAWNEGEDGKFYAFPTLFQTDGVWEPGGKESMSIAREKGELHEFDTKEEAKAFAAGSWKDKHFNK